MSSSWTLNKSSFRKLIKESLLPVLGAGWVQRSAGDAVRICDGWMVQAAFFNPSRAKSRLIAHVQPLFVPRDSLYLEWAKDSPERWFPRHSDVEAYAYGLPLLGRGDEVDSIWPEAVARWNSHRKLDPLRERLREGGQEGAVAFLEAIRRENIDRLGLQPAFDVAVDTSG